MMQQNQNTPTIKLSISHIVKDFGERRALDDVSFDVYSGELLSILGPSGCGKTTLLRILVGLLPPTSGSIWKDGKEITFEAPSNRSMGIVFQNFALFEHMTVLGNVCYALKLRPGRRADAQAAAESILEQMGLSEHIHKLPSELSGGQQQRVAIARTLVLNPDIILFDEPTSALDIETRLSLRALIQRLKKDYGTTMIYITHDQEEAFALSDRIMVMEESHKIQMDRPETILSHPANDFVRRFVLENLQKKIESLLKYTQL